MENNITVTKMIESDGKATLLVDVHYIDNIGESIKIGNYEVSDNGSLLGEIDVFISVYHKDSISNVQNIMLNSGLKAIVGDDMPISNIFGDKSSTCLNPDLCLIKNPERWSRAINYIKENNILVEETNIDIESRIR